MYMIEYMIILVSLLCFITIIFYMPTPTVVYKTRPRKRIPEKVEQAFMKRYKRSRGYVIIDINNSYNP
jgi:hypothetical protein